MELLLKYQNGTPLFSIEDDDPGLGRVYGARRDPYKHFWQFPAYPPFLEKVLHDLSKVHSLTFSENVNRHIKSVGTFAEALVRADAWKDAGPFESYDHQRQGLAELMYHYRWALRWEMGTGKSKVVVNALLYHKKKALVLCPVIAVQNWVSEIETHSGGTLTAIPMLGTKSKKFKQLRKAIENEADALIVSYDTNTRHGTPALSPKTYPIFEKARRHPSTQLRNALKLINDGAIQMRLAQEWCKGRKVPSILTEIIELRGGDAQWIADYPFEIVIGDEAHRFKSIKSIRTKAVLNIVKKAPRRFFLTGTMSLGDPRDLYTQMKGLAPYIIPGDYRRFCKDYLQYSPYNDKIPIGYKNLHKINARVNEVSSEKKLNECVDLPERRFENIYFELNSAQIKDYNYAVKNTAIIRENAADFEIQNNAVKLAKLLQICSGYIYLTKYTDVCDSCDHVRDCVNSGIAPGTQLCARKDEIADAGERETVRYPTNPKLNTLKDLLEDLLANNESKTIIWATNTAELDDISEMLESKHIGFVRVDGSNTSRIKTYEKKFTEDKECRVYLGQISTGIAITLVAAKYTIYYSRSWKLEDWLQSLGRSFRIGQEQKTVVYRLIAKHTVEEQQLMALDNRQDVSKALTTKVNCMTCESYHFCVADGIKPWTSKCLLSTDIARQTARPRVVYKS